MMDINHFIKPNGKANSVRTRESYIENHFPELYQNILDHILLYNIKTNKFSESMYYYFNNIVQNETCKNEKCSNHTSFISLTRGYLNFCSSKCSNSSIDVKQAKEKSSINKYGVKNPFQAEEVKRSLKNTMIDRYGKDNAMKVKSIKDGMISRKLEKDGVKWSLSNGGNAYHTKSVKAKEAFESILRDVRLLEYTNLKNGICKFKCNKCDHTFDANKYFIFQRGTNNIVQCIKCNPIGSFNDSRIQKEIGEWLNNVDIKFEESNRKILKGKELDIYIPEFNIAIEINGVYWHSELFKERDYHLNKTVECERQGIQLLHIFEDEWNYKKDIVKSRILSILNKNTLKIYARKCKVVELESNKSNEFLDNNHIQGIIQSSIKLGLEYNGQLVSVMTFGKLRKALGSSDKEGEYELYRFCNLRNHSVTGGASKLLKYFINKYNPVKITSYADRRWSLGKLYTAIGFDLIKETEPNWWYFKNGIRYHRFNFRKSELIRDGYDSNKSAHQIMLDRKMYRIYDSGNIKYELVL